MPRKDYIKTQLTSIADRYLPIVALVGRPNVGKSTMFNRLTQSRRAIVDPTPGMTRDRLYGTIHRDQGSFRLVDTGGIETQAELIPKMIREQTERAIAEAVAIVFLIDGREGMTPIDEDIAKALRHVDAPKILLVNKMDEGEEQLFDTSVYSLGFDTVLFGSAEHGRGIEELLEEVETHLEGHWRSPKFEPGEEPVRLAIVGRPNAGKSSLVNKMLNEERVMVSNIAGTTRDPIDSFLNYNKQPFCLVDTAGIRKRGKIEGSQESLSVMMAQRQMADADVVAVMIDATDPGASQDSAIAGLAHDAYKPIIVVVNKWDLIQNKETHTARDFEDKLRRRLKFLETAPFVFISAKTGQRVTKILDLAKNLFDRAGERVTTGVLNRFVEDMKTNYKIPTHRGKAFKIYYMTQVEVHPPTFVCVVNRTELHFGQERFLINRIREAFDLDGIPIKVHIRERSRKDKD